MLFFQTDICFTIFQGDKNHPRKTIFNKTHMQTKLIFSPNCDVGIMGLEYLHPFDARKSNKAWALLANELAKKFIPFLPLLKLQSPMSQKFIPGKSSSLRQSKLITSVIEITALRFIPNFIHHGECVAPSC